MHAAAWLRGGSPEEETCTAASGCYTVALRALTTVCPNQRTWAVQVLVRDNNVDQALRVLKKKMQREGVFREMKARKAYEKPSERKVREKAEAVRRARKAARKTAIREGLIAAPKPKPRFGGGPRRPGFSSGGGPGPQS